MKRTFLAGFCGVTSSAALALCVIAGIGWGCGKKAEDDTAAAPAAESATPAEEQAATETAAEESTTEAALEPMNVDETLRGSDKAVQAKDWSTATDSLLKLQLSGSIKNDKQSWDYNRRMTVLQDQLIQAADNGDPKAQAAIELLKRSRRVR